MINSRRGRTLLLAALLLTVPLSPPALAVDEPLPGLLPDIQTVVPKQLQIVKAHQQEFLRFSNGIANTGEGHLRFRPDFIKNTDGVVIRQDAIQEILDANGNVKSSAVVSDYEFHEEHNHWHIRDVALFQIYRGNAGPVGDPVGGLSVKVTFCLIDWYKLDDNPAHPERSYFQCGADVQGISPGWVDQYHQATEGQQLDITNLPDGTYSLVSTSNHAGRFIEQNLNNNTAWVGFKLERPSTGNPLQRAAKLSLTGVRSDCGSNKGLCGEQKDNR